MESVQYVVDQINAIQNSVVSDEISVFTVKFGELVDFNKWTFWFAFFSFAFAPTIWNIIARIEFHTHLFTKIFCGYKYIACYILAAFIFTLNIERDFAFNCAIYDQPHFIEASFVINQATALILFIIGTLLVLSSFWQLGITGTYLGDYFGILMEEKVTGFPFNTFSNPMYLGSVLNLLSASLWYGSPAGVLLAAWAHVVYYVAVTYYEGPFTTYIYQLKEAREKKEATSKAAKGLNATNNKGRNNAPSKKNK